MRKIKFRRAHYDSNGEFIKFTYWGKIGLNDEPEGDGSFAMPTHVSTCVKTFDEQLTDMFDRNGKEIYEGDILKSNSEDEMYINGDTSPVGFYGGSFHVTIAYDLHPIPLSYFETVWLVNGCKGDEETSMWLDEFEVVGNIHEQNPNKNDG